MKIQSMPRFLDVLCNGETITRLPISLCRRQGLFVTLADNEHGCHGLAICHGLPPVKLPI